MNFGDEEGTADGSAKEQDDRSSRLRPETPELAPVPPPEAPSNKSSGEDETTRLAEILPLVYEELRLLAGGYLRQERPEHTLQRTALVHEAYLWLAAQPQVNWENPQHLLAIFARLMRQTLINHAVARTRARAASTTRPRSSSAAARRGSCWTYATTQAAC